MTVQSTPLKDPVDGLKNELKFCYKVDLNELSEACMADTLD